MTQRTTFLLLSLVFLLGCPEPEVNGNEDLPDTLAWDLSEAGPFSVGYTQWEITYPGAGDGEGRTLPVHLWYPTEDESGTPATYEFIFTDDLSWVDAAPAQAVHEGGYPVLAYSHGSQGFGGATPYLHRHFASHGWVVVAPDHIGNTLTTHSSPLPLDFYLDRPADLSAALDSLEAGNGGLPSPVATERVVAAGHSFGCHTMWGVGGASFDAEAIQQRCDAGEYSEAECSDEVLSAFAGGLKDQRIVSSIPMAGGGSPSWFGQEGLLTATTPMLYMSGTDDPGAVDDVWDRTEGLEMTWMVVEGGCHQLFGLGACPLISDELGFEIIRTYALAFARQSILSDTSGATTDLLNGTTSFDDAVSIEVR
jgi:predicted dienelactone hydrolase